MTKLGILSKQFVILAALAMIAPFSCATQTPTTSSQAWNPPALALKRTPLLQNVLIDLDEHRAILVGETHTRYDHHLVQLEALKFLHQRHTDVAVGVEWFQFPFQKHVDAYLAGRISEAEMLDLTGYFDRWRFDYRLYRPIIEYAKANKLPVIALNAPQELTRKIGEVGLAKLPDEFKAQLPIEFDRSDHAYAERIKRQFDQHPGKERKFENFLDVMLTWDETMAEQAATHLQAHPQRKMVIFAGSGHVAFGSGIPDRLARRIGVPSATLLIGLEGITEPAAADYVVLSQPQSLPPAGLLGAFLEPGKKGVTIVGLSDDSALKDAGIAKGDVILSIDGTEIRSFAAVKLALLNREPGDTVTVRYFHESWLGKAVENNADVTLRGRATPEHP